MQAGGAARDEHRANLIFNRAFVEAVFLGAPNQFAQSGVVMSPLSIGNAI
jgi:hypothetical protein